MIAGTDKKPKNLKKGSAEKPLFISKHINIIPKIKVRKVITKYFSVLILSKLYFFFIKYKKIINGKRKYAINRNTCI